MTFGSLAAAALPAALAVLVVGGLIGLAVVALVRATIREQRVRLAGIINKQREIAVTAVVDALTAVVVEQAAACRDHDTAAHRDTRRDILRPFERDTYTASGELPVQPGPPRRDQRTWGQPGSPADRNTTRAVTTAQVVPPPDAPAAGWQWQPTWPAAPPAREPRGVL